jgi:hypothetical protein
MFKVRCYVNRTPLFAELNISGRYSAVENICKYSEKIVQINSVSIV